MISNFETLQSVTKVTYGHFSPAFRRFTNLRSRYSIKFFSNQKEQMLLILNT